MLKIIRLLLMAFSALFNVSLLGAGETPSPALLVLNKSDNMLAIVDPVSLQVVAKSPAGNDPHEVVASGDGKLAFISNYGGFSGGFRTITVVDLINQKTLKKQIDLGGLRAPHGMTFAGGKVYFTTEGSKTIGRYDPATQKIDWVLGIGQDRTHMIWVSDDEQLIVTSNVNSNTMSIIEKSMDQGDGPHGQGLQGPPPGMMGGPDDHHDDGKMPPPMPHANWNISNIPVGKGPEGFDVSPDQKEIWAANSHEGTVSVINVAQKKVVATLSVPMKMANRLKFTPDGTKVLISDLGGNGISIIDVKSRKEIKRLDLGGGAAGILMQPDGAKAYVAVGQKNGIAVIDLKTLEESGFINSGKGPDGLAWVDR